MLNDGTLPLPTNMFSGDAEGAVKLLQGNFLPDNRKSPGQLHEATVAGMLSRFTSNGGTMTARQAKLLAQAKKNAFLAAA